MRTNKIDRNPKGILQADMKCPYYHPDLCCVLGHASRRDKNCALHGKSAEIVKHAKDEIEKGLIES